MSALRETLLHWIDKRTAEMLAAPRSWGSDEAIEMQVLLLLQFRALTLRPDFAHGDPGSLVDDYMEYLTRAYPKHLHRPLHQIVEPDALGLNIAGELKKIVEAFKHDMLEAKAEMGDTFVGRAGPVELAEEHERRFLAVLRSSAPFELYDSNEEVRSIDSDRSIVIVNRKARLPCYARPEHLQEVTEVGIQAHVQGTLYRPLAGRPFVIVSHIVPIDTEAPAA